MFKAQLFDIMSFFAQEVEKHPEPQKESHQDDAQDGPVCGDVDPGGNVPSVLPVSPSRERFRVCLSDI